MNTLRDKVALITGASSRKGMGRAIALRLAGEGAMQSYPINSGFRPAYGLKIRDREDWIY